MGCIVSNQIAVHADQPEQRSISEILSELLEHDEVWVADQLIELHEISTAMCADSLQEAAQESLQGNSLAIYELYIKTLEGFINELNR